VGSRGELVHAVGDTCPSVPRTSAIAVGGGATARPTRVQEEECRLQEALRELEGFEGLVGQSGVDCVRRIGRIVVEVLYGSVEGWRTRTRGDLSYARLEQHPLLAVNASKIYRAVRVYELCERVAPEAVRGLSLSHLLVVLGAEPERQQSLLLRASDQGWSVRQLRSATAQKGSSPPNTGRPRVPPIIRTLRQVLANEAAFDGTESLLTLGSREARTLYETCRRAQRALSLVEKQLTHVLFDRKRPSVLLVDAAPSFALRAQRQLRRQGCRVRVVESAAAAREVVAADTDCCIIDPVLPDGCGVELAEELSKLHPHLSCIFVTDQPRSELPPKLAASSLVDKASGLLALRVAVATSTS
jgi:CheY-like chemotaxis protein